MTASWRSIGAWAVPAALFLAACGSTTPRPVRPDTDLHHPSATRRLEAVAAVGRSRDLRHVPALIDLLEDPDAGVRLTASRTLEDLTGRDTGYRPYDPPEALARQAAEWRAWWAARGGAGGGGGTGPRDAGGGR